jgi:signal peptidase
MLIVRDAYFSSPAAKETADGADAQPATENRGISPLLLFAGGVMVAVIWLNSGLLGVTPYLVSGPSMKPGLSPGDVVVARDVEPEAIAIGDIIRVRTANGFVIHRVVQIDETDEGLWFTTKGDNNNVRDAPIRESQVAGKVVFDLPYAGWVPIKLKELVGG